MLWGSLCFHVRCSFLSFSLSLSQTQNQAAGSQTPWKQGELLQALSHDPARICLWLWWTHLQLCGEEKMIIMNCRRVEGSHPFRFLASRASDMSCTGLDRLKAPQGLMGYLIHGCGLSHRRVKVAFLLLLDIYQDCQLTCRHLWNQWRASRENYPWHRLVFHL